MIDLSLPMSFIGSIPNVTYSSLTTISHLLEDYPVIDHEGSLNRDIKNIVYDSRKAKPGSLFVAIPGIRRDGTRFIPDALAGGALAVITESPIASIKHIVPDNVTLIQVKDTRNALAFISCRFYDLPSAKLNLIGITGTNGKTTVSYLLESILTRQNEPTGVIGTIEYRFGNKRFPAGMTTPESTDINRILKEMTIQGIRFCALEVSSHALTFQRVSGLEFAVTVFTNLSRDHLDFHDTLEAYMLSKKSLFHRFPKARRVVNTDDLLGLEIFEESPQETLTTGIHKIAEVMAENIETDAKGVRFNLKTPIGTHPIRSSLLGKHNVYNILSAAGAALQLGIPLESIVRGVEALEQVPGRFERVELGQDFTVVVDYAHTDDALKNILKAAREFIRGRVIVVFGCGGDRDRGKRSEMGYVAFQESDFVVITSDNPRSEDPGQIIQEVLNGLPIYAQENDRFACIPNRGEAIEFAINKARAGDIVLIAGKGHEDYQILNSGTIHFNDREVATAALKKRLNLD